MNKSLIKWLDDVEDHDFDAARTYLTLRRDAKFADKKVGKMRHAKLSEWRANDILRAADRDPAPLGDPGVARDLHKVIEQKALSPVLLANLDVGVEIADGFHRVSLAYHIDPFSYIPARLA